MTKSILVGRIEAAQEDDPALFWEAFHTIHGPKPERVHGGSKEMDDYLAKSNPFFYFVKHGAFLDAAMSLVEPRALWAHGSMEDGPFARLCWPQPDGSFVGGYVEASCATVPLSIVAASLKALALTKDSSHGY